MSNTTKGSEKIHKARVINTVAYRLSCVMCKAPHNLYRCDKYNALSPKERLERAKSLNLCTNCLAAGHTPYHCKSRGCFKCNKKHHTSLHMTVPEIDNNYDSKGTSVNAHCQKGTTQTLLPTACILIKSSKGDQIKARALLDSGSDSHYITKALCNKLNIQYTVNEPITISGVNNSTSKVTQQAEANIYSLHTAYRRKLSFLVVEKITQDLPLLSFDSQEFKIPEHVCLADDTYNISSRIDLLIGAEIFYDLLYFGKICLGNNNPVLQNSKLGWLVTGRFKIRNNVKSCHLNVTVDNSMLHNYLERFWVIDDLPQEKLHTHDETICENEFEKLTERDRNGRYIVRLPFNEKKDSLGDSFHTALKRFYKLEYRLRRNEQLKIEYSKFLKEYEDLAHMRKICEINTQINADDINIDEFLEQREIAIKGYYIPHHPVFKATSSTTKLRVVFDASALTTTKVSLNNILRVGPTIQSDLFSILIRFRTRNIIISADIEKMFRQVLVNDSDQGFQRILWRENSNEPSSIYQLQTVTYGTSPATFLTTRCLKDLALQFQSLYPIAARAILEDTYVDDVITGCNNIQDAIILRNELSLILSSGCFNLRKWCSNSEEVLSNFTNTDQTSKHLIRDINDNRTLGIIWNSKTDVLNFTIETRNEKNTYETLINFIKDDVTKTYLLENNIVWKFMPPRAPHFGGLHEAAIKSMKRHLKKVIGNSVLTIEGLNTILCQIEGILNSRPLFPTSNDPNDLTALTPGHFIIGSPLTALPQDGYSQPRNFYKNDYEKLQHVILDFWKRWNKEYICNLQTRNKWKKNVGTKIEIGKLVLIKEDYLPPQMWVLGRVVKVLPGPDGECRVAAIKTTKGEFIRSATKLCVLPYNEDFSV